MRIELLLESPVRVGVDRRTGRLWARVVLTWRPIADALECFDPAIAAALRDQLPAGLLRP